MQILHPNEAPQPGLLGILALCHLFAVYLQMEETWNAEEAVCLQCLTVGWHWYFPKWKLSGNIFVRTLTDLCVYGENTHQMKGSEYLCRECAKAPCLAGSDLLFLSQVPQCIVVFMDYPAFSHLLRVLHKYEWICHYTSWMGDFQTGNRGTERQRCPFLSSVRFSTLCLRRATCKRARKAEEKSATPWVPISAWKKTFNEGITTWRTWRSLWHTPASLTSAVHLQPRAEVLSYLSLCS